MDTPKNRASKIHGKNTDIAKRRSRQIQNVVWIFNTPLPATDRIENLFIDK